MQNYQQYYASLGWHSDVKIDSDWIFVAHRQSKWEKRVTYVEILLPPDFNMFFYVSSEQWRNVLTEGFASATLGTNNN